MCVTYTHTYVALYIDTWIYAYIYCMYICACTYNIYSAARNATHTHNSCTTLRELMRQLRVEGCKKNKNEAVFAAGANSRVCCCLARVSCSSSQLQLESVAAAGANSLSSLRITRMLLPGGIRLAVCAATMLLD
jgi:hypothetical protein